MKKSNVTLLAVLLLTTSLVFGKEKNIADYGIKFTVLNTTYDQPFDPKPTDIPNRDNYKCNMILKGSDGRIYQVYSNGFCKTFDAGAVVNGKLTSFMGVRLLELAWPNGSKVKTCKYTIRNVSIAR